MELLITEDGEKYTEYEGHFNARLERKTKVNIPDDLFLQAEIRMQWAFVYLKFGREFDAALNLRQSYLTIQELKSRFPKFEAIKKTSGLLQILIGPVPQKYNWVLAMLNMEGSTEDGFKELKSLGKSGGVLSFEANLINALLDGLLLQRPDVGLQGIKTLLSTHPQNRLALFLGSALAIKDAKSEQSLAMLDSLAMQSKGLMPYHTDYMRGEIYLYRGDYVNSIASFRWFVNNYRGQNGVKDAHYKIGLCYWLNGNSNDAQIMFKSAKTAGKEASEADKYAARSLAESELPHIQLTKARYATDGGYYAQAKQILESLDEADIPSKRDQVEYYYRRARLAHKLNVLKQAKPFYLKTINLSGDGSWYYAPNACLQMGYITLSEGDTGMAKSYFNKAISYGKHEYKNSIDSKAKSAIAQIKRK